MDNGKPIRESRDLDIPLVARHFYHHAGTCRTEGGDLQKTENNLFQMFDYCKVN